MRLFYSPYTLKVRRGELNARTSSRERQGALLKVEWPHQTGFADCCPWPELGQLPLSQQLAALASGRLTPLLKQSLTCARLDAEGRAREQNLLQDLPIPESHYLVTGALQDSDLARAWARGFRIVKLKIGSDLNDDTKRIQHLIDTTEFQLRLDANGVLTSEQATQLACHFAPFKRIEFWEDPCPYDPAVWEALNKKIPLALDQAADQETGRELSGFQFAIYKPAWTDLDVIRLFPRLCVTSALDHPVGQCFAALMAGRLAVTRKMEICGLQSHPVYEQNAFSEALGPALPQFQVPDGWGLGFDSLLKEQKWTELL